MAAGIRDVLALQGVLPLNAVPPTPPGPQGYFGLLDFQGVWVLQAIPPIPKDLVKKANWGSWCKRFTVPSP